MHEFDLRWPFYNIVLLFFSVNILKSLKVVDRRFKFIVGRLTSSTSLS